MKLRLLTPRSPRNCSGRPRRAARLRCSLVGLQKSFSTFFKLIFPKRCTMQQAFLWALAQTTGACILSPDIAFYSPGTYQSKKSQLWSLTWQVACGVSWKAGDGNSVSLREFMSLNGFIVNRALNKLKDFLLNRWRSGQKLIKFYFTASMAKLFCKLDSYVHS